MKIGKHDTSESVFIIAEIGNNHEGSFKRAEKMIGKAAETGADAVKFQTIVPDRLVSVRQKARIKQLQKFQLSYGQFEKLARIAERESVVFLSTPFDLKSAIFLNPLVPAFKIASSDNLFFPLIDTVCHTGKPILVSSGLSDHAEIEKTVNRVRKVWERSGIVQDLAVLHCVSCYPTPPEEANLSAILTLRALGVTAGYSDHTLGIEAAVLSVALGAEIIEKHFTLNKDASSFQDHRLSADPEEFRRLVEAVRKATLLLGSKAKMVSPCENAQRREIRRSIAAADDLAPETMIGWEQISWVRPGGGLPPGKENDLIGRRTRASVAKGEWLLPENLIEE